MPNTKNYRQRLYAEKEELLRQIKALKMRFNQSQGDSMQELSTYDNHPADIGTETFERSKIWVYWTTIFCFWPGLKKP